MAGRVGRMPELGADRLLPPPKSAAPSRPAGWPGSAIWISDGRLRFDAVARYVQDVSGDDTVDAGLDNVAWVVRRTKVAVGRSPRFREQLTLCTFCSGLGRRWAERRVSVVGDQGAAIESVSLWIHLDADTGRPVPMPEAFHRQYDQAAAGRVVSTRLQHDADPPADARRATVDVAGHRLRPAGSREQRGHLGSRRGGAGRAPSGTGTASRPSSSTAWPSSRATPWPWPPPRTPTVGCASGSPIRRPSRPASTPPPSYASAPPEKPRRGTDDTRMPKAPAGRLADRGPSRSVADQSTKKVDPPHGRAGAARRWPGPPRPPRRAGPR